MFSKSLPDLSGEKILAIDIETCDPNLLKLGPGVKRDGYVVGISLATEDGRSWYLPIDHDEGFNYESENVLKYLSDLLYRPIPKIGANIMYDLDYLKEAGVKISGPFIDIQVAESLLNENRKSYSLQAIAEDYFSVGKYEDEIDQWVKENISSKANPKGFIHRIPSELVAKYAKEDAVLPMKIWNIQKDKLEEQNLMELFETEMNLLEVVLLMRHHGVRIDTGYAKELEALFIERMISDTAKLNEIAGFEVNVNAATSIAILCDKLGIKYGYTKKSGAPSFTQGWMQLQENPIFDLILNIRKWEKYRGTFIHGSILKYAIHDRIYCQFISAKNGRNGTVTGRFSSANPNLQFIPSRDPELGKKVRSIFLPEEGEDWYKFDYSAIEPRLSMHYSDHQEIKNKLWEDPSMDVYQPMMDLLPHIPRKTIKTIYLGLSYSMGIKALADKLQMPINDAKSLLNEFNHAIPYLKDLSYRAKKTAESRGYVRTLSGRRRRFYSWIETRTGEMLDSESIPTGRYQRAFCYKAFNALIQGGSADIIKKAMVDLYKDGVFEESGPPLLTVHDELDFSLPRDKKGKELAKEIKHTMENTVELTVPLNVDMEIGTNWGTVK